MKKTLWAVLLCSAATVFAANSPSEIMLDDCSNAAVWQNKDKKYAAAAAVKDNTRDVIQITHPGMTLRRGLSGLSPIPERNAMNGVSLEIKGNGDDFHLPFSLVGYGSNRGWTYTAYLHIRGTEWRKYTLRWDQFTAGDGNPYWDFNMPGAFGPDGIDGLMFGDRWNIWYCNRKYPVRKVLVRNIKMVKDVPAKVQLVTTPGQRVKDVIAKMKAGKKVLIMCTGDSITAGTGVKDADLNRYGVKLQKKLREFYKNNNINVEVVAVGGARTYDLRVWSDRDYPGKRPDLVTIMIGYNDKSSRNSAAYYKESLSRAVNRILTASEGTPAILLLPPIPGRGPRYNMMNDYTDACIALAKERDLEYFELAPLFKKLPRATTFDSYFDDMAHPNADGHEFIASKLAEYLTR